MVFGNTSRDVGPKREGREFNREKADGSENYLAEGEAIQRARNSRESAIAQARDDIQAERYRSALMEKYSEDVTAGFGISPEDHKDYVQASGAVERLKSKMYEMNEDLASLEQAGGLWTRTVGSSKTREIRRDIKTLRDQIFEQEVIVGAIEGMIDSQSGAPLAGQQEQFSATRVAAETAPEATIDSKDIAAQSMVEFTGVDSLDDEERAAAILEVEKSKKIKQEKYKLTPERSGEIEEMTVDSLELGYEDFAEEERLLQAEILVAEKSGDKTKLDELNDELGRAESEMRAIDRELENKDVAKDSTQDDTEAEILAERIKLEKHELTVERLSELDKMSVKALEGDYEELADEIDILEASLVIAKRKEDISKYDVLMDDLHRTAVEMQAIQRELIERDAAEGAEVEDIVEPVLELVENESLDAKVDSRRQELEGKDVQENLYSREQFIRAGVAESDYGAYLESSFKLTEYEGEKNVLTTKLKEVAEGKTFWQRLSGSKEERALRSALEQKKEQISSQELVFGAIQGEVESALTTPQELSNRAPTYAERRANQRNKLARRDQIARKAGSGRM